MKVGDTVKYSRPTCKAESEFRFTLLHVEKGKADIQLVCGDLIRPIETVATGEIEPAAE